MNLKAEIITLFALAVLAVQGSEESTVVPAVAEVNATGGASQSDSKASRYSAAIGFEAEDVAMDTADYCRKIKDLANKTSIEATDANQEVVLSDQVAAMEAGDYYLYAKKESYKMAMLAEMCITFMDDSLTMENSLVDLANDLREMSEGSTNKSMLREKVDDIVALIENYRSNVTLWSFAFTDMGDNVIAALRGAQQEVESDPNSDEEAVEDAKETKNRIKVYVDEIVQLAENLLDDANESYDDMLEDVDGFKAESGMYL